MTPHPDDARTGPDATLTAEVDVLTVESSEDSEPYDAALSAAGFAAAVWL